MFKLAADPETVQARLAECAACVYLSGRRCLRCGCFIAAKARLEQAKCPDGKWQRLTAPVKQGE